MLQNCLNKLERKFGKYAIHGFMKYVVAIELIGALIGIMNANIYYTYFSLDFAMILKGQIWRLFTFVFFPEITSLAGMNILFFAIRIYLYYMIGNTLENVWGAFRFNLYYLSGLILSVIAGLIVYLTLGIGFWPVGFEYINNALFLAFATIFPNMEFLLFFILPIKAKWLGILYAVLIGLEVLSYIGSGSVIGYVFAFAIIISMLNFLLFFFGSRDFKNNSYKARKRRKEFQQKMGPKVVPLYRHRCAICGRTEKDGDDLEFRFCSKCEGNYEYCQDHIFTHEHVHK